MADCFVVMGFGKKTDFATGRELDLNKSYNSIIKPAVTAAGYNCIRADEIQHSGVIDVPMYDMLFGAELVVADLSTANLNAVFELGIRYALKPRTTVIIAESKFAIPFDASHIVVRKYEHLGSAIDFDEAMRMQKELTDLINALKKSKTPDSPVYVTMQDLQMPTRPPPKAEETPTAAAANAPSPAAQAASTEDSYAVKLQMALEARDKGNFAFAKEILHWIYGEQSAPGADGQPKPVRPFIVQQLALVTYKAGEAGGVNEALKGYAEAENLLKQLDIDRTTDPETLGLWSSIHKRRAEIAARSLEERMKDIDQAIRAVERGFIIKRDYYNGTNLAYLLNWRASLSSDNDRIADNVLANRVRREVADIAASALKALPEKSAAQEDTAALRDEKYWIAATHAESLIALGEKPGDELMQQVLASAPAPWMAKSTKDQLAKLQALLAQASQASGARP